MKARTTAPPINSMVLQLTIIIIQDTLILVTFDENHSYTTQNRVLGILLGGAVPANLVGTTDSNYYGTVHPLYFSHLPIPGSC